MNGLTLARVLQPDDVEGTILRGSVKQVYSNGLVDVDLGGGRIATSCEVLSTYTPATGDKVRLMRQSASLWLVFGTVRTSNPTTVTVGKSIAIPWTITPPTPTSANPSVVSVTATGSYRSGDSPPWSGAFLPTSDDVAQGAYSTTYGYYQGCYFYGTNPWASLAGRTCTRLQIKIVRKSSGGDSGATQQIIAPHVHESQPGDDPPYFADNSFNAGSLAWGASGVFDLPVQWGNALIAGTYKGFGHMLLASGNGNYSINAGRSTDATVGQITLTWA